MNNSTDEKAAPQSTTNTYTIALLSFTGAMLLLVLIIWLALKLMGVKSPHTRSKSGSDLNNISKRYGFSGFKSKNSNRPFTQSVGYPISRKDLGALAKVDEEDEDEEKTVTGRGTILPVYKTKSNLASMTVIIEVPPNCVMRDGLGDLPPEYKNRVSENRVGGSRISESRIGGSRISESRISENRISENSTYVTALSRVF
jgi:hypothetical protein